jgi:hypothetical protein
LVTDPDITAALTLEQRPNAERKNRISDATISKKRVRSEGVLLTVPIALVALGERSM